MKKLRVGVIGLGMGRNHVASFQSHKAANVVAVTDMDPARLLEIGDQYGVPGRYLSREWRVHADFLQVMITAVGELTHLYLPAMEAAGRGRILNIASLAGLVPASAGHTMYGATKAWLIRFSECLALESGPRGVHVTALCPGFTYSEFHDVNGMRGKISKMPKALWLTSAEVARLGVDAVEAGKTRVVTGGLNNVVAFVSKYLPDWLARALVASKSKDFRDAD